MAEPVKFTEDELKQVKGIQDNYVSIQNEFGQLKIARIRLESQLSSMEDREQELNQNFSKLQEDERVFLDKITEKYGQGTLNPETGEFVPNK